MTPNDWKDSLLKILDEGTLPEGEETSSEPAEDNTIAPQKLNVIVERKGHRGKTVTIIEGFTCPDDRLQSIASDLKRHLGTGGSARSGEILVQGDRRDEVIKWLKSRSLMR